MRGMTIAGLLIGVACSDGRAQQGDATVAPRPSSTLQKYATAEDAWQAFRAAAAENRVDEAAHALSRLVELEPKACKRDDVDDAVDALRERVCPGGKEPACKRMADMCRPKAGDECEKNKAACEDEATLLSCHEGRFVEVACRGSKGCTTDDDTVECDFGRNRFGDRCTSDIEGQGDCGADGVSIVTCRDQLFRVQPCRGPRGCRKVDKTSTCDTSRAQVGDLCEGTGYTCSIDAKAIIRCVDHAAVLDEACLPGTECVIVDNKAGCMKPR
jgi:hypothetical protein